MTLSALASFPGTFLFNSLQPPLNYYVTKAGEGPGNEAISNNSLVLIVVRFADLL